MLSKKCNCVVSVISRCYSPWLPVVYIFMPVLSLLLCIGEEGRRRRDAVEQEEEEEEEERGRGRESEKKRARGRMGEVRERERE